jgi:pimeloyl-ACP methyl ester carboxylesterase
MILGFGPTPASAPAPDAPGAGVPAAVGTHEEWRTIVARAEVNGTSLEYVENGEGQPLVFVHGSASDIRTWHNQEKEFGNHFRVITYSRRYHWPNEPIGEGADYSMLEHVWDLGAFLRALGAAPVHLVGHSYGAFVCLLLAVQEPGLIRTLVLAEPPAVTLFVSYPPRPPEILRLMISRPRTAAAIVKFGARGIQPTTAALRRGDTEGAIQIFGRTVLGSQAYRSLSESRREQVRANFLAAEFLGSGYPPLEASDVQQVRCPTLLLYAQRSPRLFHRLIDRLQELLPNAKRVEVRDASHIMHEDNPSEYNAAVLSHLQKHSKTS